MQTLFFAAFHREFARSIADRSHLRSLSKVNKLNCTRLYFIIAWNIRLFMIQVGDKDGKEIKAMYTISV